MGSIGLGALAVCDEVGEVRFEDPFRWLEDDSPRTWQWEEDQDRRAAATLRALPAWRALLPAVAAALDELDAIVPIRCGARSLRLRRDAATGVVAACTVTVDDEPERLLFAAADLLGGVCPTIDWLLPSPSGRLLAVGVSSGGDEQTALRFVDAASGRALGIAVANLAGGAPAWLPDESGVVCLAGRASDQRSMRRQLLLATPAGVRCFAELPAQRSRRIALQMSRDGRWLALLADPAAPQLTHVLDIPGRRWMTVPRAPTGTTFAGAFAPGRYVAIATGGASAGRLVSAPLTQVADPAAWRELVPERPGEVLRAVAVAGEELVLFSVVDGRTRCRLLTLVGEPVAELPLPPDGVVCVDPASPEQYGVQPPVRFDANGFSYSCTRAGAAPVAGRVDLPVGCGGEVGRRLQPAVEWERRHAVSSDGHAVRFDIVRRRGADRDRPRPTLLVAYGGWNAVSTARGHLGPLEPFVAAGGDVAFAHVRGDATGGAAQWHGGRRERKQHSFDDAIAVADQLRRTLGPGGRLGLWGVSNGGLLVGALVTQRPELFDAAIALVPLFDMGRFVRERFAEYFTWEYGDPRLADEAAVLRAYSPYHNVCDQIDCPPLLVVCAENDVRIHPWHGRKLVARLLAAGVPPERVLLRVQRDCGHLAGGHRGPTEMAAEWVAFAIDRLCLAPPSCDDHPSADGVLALTADDVLTR